MVPTILVAAALAATGPKPVNLAAPVFNVINVSDKLAGFYTDHFAQRMSTPELHVTTAGEIASLLGFERQKELLNCTDKSTNCTVELANALGVDGIVRGTIAKLGARYTIDLKVLAASDAHGIAQWSGDATSEEEVVGALERAAVSLRQDVLRVLRPQAAAAPVPVAATPPPPPATHAVAASPGPRWPWVPVAAGAGAAIAGGVLLGISFDQASQLGGATQPLRDPSALKSSAEVNRGLGVALLSAGVASAAIGAYFLATSSGSVAPAVSAGPQGWSVGLAGALP